MRSRKNQVSMEMLLIIVFALTIFVVVFSMLSKNIASMVDEKDKSTANEIGNAVKNEIILAMGSSDGYKRVFEIPIYALGSEVDAYINARANFNYSEIIIVLYTGENTIKSNHPVEGVLYGNLTPGMNAVKNIDGEVFVNYFECSDHEDNDGDGALDYPDDSGCEDYFDDDESTFDSSLECQNNIDDDNDGVIDLADSDCSNMTDDNESGTVGFVAGECNDGLDNDGDGYSDYMDPGCYTDGNYTNMTKYERGEDENRTRTCSAIASCCVSGQGTGLRYDRLDPTCSAGRQCWGECSVACSADGSNLVCPSGCSCAQDPDCCECSDTQNLFAVDNDGDGYANADDPDCHSDCDPYNYESYVSSRNSESGYCS